MFPGKRPEHWPTRLQFVGFQGPLFPMSAASVDWQPEDPYRPLQVIELCVLRCQR
jgi:hypothetical protein